MFRRSIDEGLKPLAVDPNADTHIDGLTGLPDRWQLESWLAEHQMRNRRTGDRFGLFFVSVANLVEINAGYGSAVGDEVLQTVAEALQSAVGSRGLLARYLGSEFAVLWPGLFGDDETNRVAVSLVASLPQQVTFDAFVVPIEMAVAGVLSDPDLSERVLLVDAESALAEARMRRSNRMVVRSEAYGSRRSPDVLSVRLQRAFDSDEFQLYHQPIVSLNSGALVGFEAVLRWLSPDAGPLGAELLAPGVFLEALRSSPIVVPLHAWVLREAASQVSLWSKQLRSQSLFTCTNLDPSFVRSERFTEIVRSTLADMQLRPTQLLLDLNGDSIGAQITQLWPQLQQLKADGVGISLEDFGIGYGSADLLRRCRFDVIRIPRAFVGGLGLADENLSIVTHLIRLAHDMGCYVIGEGIETPEQAMMLSDAGCDLGQGYLYGRPTTAAEVTTNLDAQVRNLAQLGVEKLREQIEQRSASGD